MTCHHLQWTWLTWRQGCALHILIFFLLKAVASKVVWLALVFLFLFTSRRPLLAESGNPLFVHQIELQLAEVFGDSSSTRVGSVTSSPPPPGA
jgi:hypothetical protein